MSSGTRFRLLLGASAVALTAVLLATSLRTFQELDEQRTVYLRSRAATLAARLETLPRDLPVAEIAGQLSEEEPGLIDVTLIDPDSEAGRSPRLGPIWSGRRLYLTADVRVEGEAVFRAWVPFHAGGRLRIARIDLAASSADFLLTHARHNLWVSIAGGGVLILLALATLWTTHRMAQLQRRHLEVEHLAHIGKMAAVLAHEIRNPLGTIKGFAQLLAERLPAADRPLLDPVLTETSRLEALVNDLLRYGRPPQPQLREVRWTEIARALSDHAAAASVKQGIRFSARGGDFALRTDPQLLVEALLNLVRNAMEALAADPAGEVRLEADFDPAQGAVIRVADNGPGIPEPVRARLFEPFFTTKAFGTGLGLPISRKLVRSLGGDLQLRAGVPNGTVAELRIPNPALRALHS